MCLFSDNGRSDAVGDQAGKEKGKIPVLALSGLRVMVVSTLGE